MSVSLPLRFNSSSASVATSSIMSGHRLASSLDLRLPHTTSTGLRSWLSVIT